jgi:hypothetical protein
MADIAILCLLDFPLLALDFAVEAIDLYLH